MHVEDVLPPDAIPSIDEPTFGRHFFGRSDDEVIVVDGDPPRAYPIRILSYHEIVNDEVDGRPVAVTWCPICWSAAVYDRRVEGRTLTFGVSGKLADDALVMYDRETGSEWKQPTGAAIAGSLQGATLEALSGPMVTWERFREDHPDGLVLQPVRGGSSATDEELRAMHDMERYRAYVDGEHFGLYGMRGEGEPREWDREDLDAKELVLGLKRDRDAVGVPRERVAAAGGCLRASVGDGDVVVVLVDDRLYAFEAPDFELALHDGELRGDDATWDPVLGESGDGRALERVPGRHLFAFAWQDAHGPDAFV